MNNLKYELKKQLLYCHVMEKFRAAVYVSSRGKIGCVNNILFDIFDNSSRGNKINGCLIDEDISNDVKQKIVYPQLFPRIISLEDFKLESWDDVKKRVVEVEIQTMGNK